MIRPGYAFRGPDPQKSLSQSHIKMALRWELGIPVSADDIGISAVYSGYIFGHIWLKKYDLLVTIL